MNKRNNFICIGAVHSDYILKLKNNYFKNRSNPIYHEEYLGGVAYNIAKILSFLNQSTKLYSLDCSNYKKKEIQIQGIKFKTLNKIKNNSYYTSVIDKNGKMILGLANMDDYEKLIDTKILKNYRNKKIILDLNLSLKLIKKIVNKYSKNNYICVCGTSAHKIYKIKTLLLDIDTLIVNKQESFNLTNKKTIKESMKYLINKNKNLNIVITNGKKSVNAYLKKKIYLAYPPKTIVKNENGAGDALIAVFNYFICNYSNQLEALNKSVCAGSLKASGYSGNKVKYLKKIDRMFRSLKFKIKN